MASVLLCCNTGCTRTIEGVEDNIAREGIHLNATLGQFHWERSGVVHARGPFGGKGPDGFRVLDKIVPWNGIQATFGPFGLGSRELVITL